MKRLRILNVAASLRSWGGVEKHICDIAPALASRGHDVIIACPPRSEIERRALETQVPVVHLTLDSPLDWKKLPGFARAMAGRYDVVHTHHPGDYLIPAVAARIARVPLVVQSMHVPPHMPSAWSRLAHRAL
ncbi:MAG: glycosyltransferase family 4 protein, partial [Terriglobia bacterium]